MPDLYMKKPELQAMATFVYHRSHDQLKDLPIVYTHDEVAVEYTATKNFCAKKDTWKNTWRM